MYSSLSICCFLNFADKKLFVLCRACWKVLFVFIDSNGAVSFFRRKWRCIIFSKFLEFLFIDKFTVIERRKVQKETHDILIWQFSTEKKKEKNITLMVNMYLSFHSGKKRSVNLTFSFNDWKLIYLFITVVNYGGVGVIKQVKQFRY